jgi:long-chain acyl-CoA synthetase
MTDHRPWFASYPSDVAKTLEPYPERTVSAALEDAAERFGDRPAVAFFGRHLSYGALLREVERFSGVLAGAGVRRGDRVGLLLPNTPQYVIAFHATVRLGAIAVGLSPLYTRRELSHVINDAGVKVIVVLDQVFDRLEHVRGEVGTRGTIVTRLTDYMRFPLNLLTPLKLRWEARKEGEPWPPVPVDAPVAWWGDLMDDVGSAPSPAAIDVVEDPAALLYTGGTTGLPKGAMLSHRNVVVNAMQGAAWFPMLRDGREATMCILPFFHSFGMLAMNLTILKAGKLILLPKFELKRTLRQIQKEKPTLFPGVPRLFIALNEAPEARRYDLGSITACISGAAPLPQAVAERFEQITGGATLVEGYGLTETSPVTHANPLQGRRKAGSIGLPLPDTDCRIVDLDDPERTLGAEEPGELCIRGPQVMLGYWNMPKETAETVQDGWVRSGDVAVMDEDGYFSIVDRIKDLIIVSGYNVYPNEVEEVLYGHPKISKVSVIGVPDDETGEAVKAFIVLKEGEEATAAEIQEWASDPDHGLAAYRVPTRIEFRRTLPESLAGKVLRRELRDEEEAREQQRDG